MLESSVALKENDPNHCDGDDRLNSTQKQLISGSFSKKRKVTDISNYNHDEQPETTMKTSTADPTTATTDWETLFKALQAERVTKAEALLYAYRQESEEREKLMRSYNLELEDENQKLKSELTAKAEQTQQFQDLENQVQQLQTTMESQAVTIQAFQKFTGATLSNFASSDKNDTTKHDSLNCDCTVTNPETKVMTKFRITTVSSNAAAKNLTDENGDDNKQDTLLKYQILENPTPLPEFLHEEIEFESSQLPPLLQNVLAGIFPDE